jgi:hypothetical protein
LDRIAFSILFKTAREIFVRLFVEIVSDVPNVDCFRKEKDKPEPENAKRNCGESKIPSPGKIFCNVSTDYGTHGRAGSKCEVPDCHTGSAFMNKEDICSQK